MGIAVLILIAPLTAIPYVFCQENIWGDVNQRQTHCNNTMHGSKWLDDSDLQKQADRLTAKHFENSIHVIFCVSDMLDSKTAYLMFIDSDRYAIVFDKEFLDLIKKKRGYTTALISHELAHLKIRGATVCESAKFYQRWNDQADCERLADSVAAEWTGKRYAIGLLKEFLAFAKKHLSEDPVLCQEIVEMTKYRIAALEGGQ